MLVYVLSIHFQSVNQVQLSKSFGRTCFGSKGLRDTLSANILESGRGLAYTSKSYSMYSLYYIYISVPHNRMAPVVQAWIEAVTGERVVGPFGDALRDGVVICKVIERACMFYI